MRNSGKGSSRIGSLKIMGAVLIAMLLATVSAYLYAVTVVGWWVPLLIAFIGALALWGVTFPLWERLMPSSPVWGRMAVHIVAAMLLITTAVLGANRLGTTQKKVSEVEAIVVGKHREKRYHTRRLGQGRYVRDREYYVYKITLELPDGRRKEREVNLATYSHTALHSTLSLRLSPGLFGWPVLLPT